MMFVLPALLLSISSVQAHGIIRHWIVNGERKAGFNPAYPPEHGPTAMRKTNNADWGFANFHSGEVACGGWDATGDGLTWDVDAGSTVTAHWDSWDWGHRGPVMEYMARCPDSGCTGVPAQDLDWFKIGQRSYDGNAWASETITRDRDWSFQIPGDIAPGNYIIRHEIIAMHVPNEPQVYPVCFQANVRGSGNAVPSSTVRFPDAYTRDLEWTRHNLYWQSDPNAYVPPGGPISELAAGSGGSAPAPSPAPAPPASSSPASGGGGGSGGGNGNGNGNGNGGETPSPPAPAPAPQPTSTTPSAGSTQPAAPPVGKCRRRRRSLKAGLERRRIIRHTDRRA